MYLKEQILKEIIERPDVYLILQQAKSILGNEYIKRKQFYKEVSENQKAEFINGQIVLHSPVRQIHNQTNLLLASLLNAYVNKNDLGFIGIEKIMISLTRNDYEPDICFFKKEKSNQFKPEQVLFPVPDFVVEILSESTKKNDRGIKFMDYEAHGIEEYWIIDPEKKIIEQYHLEDQQYNEVKKSDDGVIKSFVVEGFEILVQSIFDKEMNNMVLSSILSTDI
ncbi:MAG: Uma2 family endonuclease [Bacteroidales bacterium]|nr:Uma2 family endonuclease [Bacteroidales bacterium]